MVKKYHQSRKDRHDESVGMERYEREKRGGEGAFESFLHEDHRAPANLPQHTIHRTVGCSVGDLDYELDDGMKGLDEVMKDDKDKMNRYMSDTKY